MSVTKELELMPRLLCGVVAGVLMYSVVRLFTRGKHLKDIASVHIGKIEVRDSELYVDDIYVTNTLGTQNSQKIVREQGMAAVITPTYQHFRITLDNYGQRQAILFEVCRALGVKRYQFTRKEYETGRIVVVLVPIINDEDFLLKVIREAPLLEDVTKSHQLIKVPLKSEERN